MKQEEYDEVHVLVHPYYCGLSEEMEDGFYENYLKEVAQNPRALLLVISSTITHSKLEKERDRMRHRDFHPAVMQDRLVRHARGLLGNRLLIHQVEPFKLVRSETGNEILAKLSGSGLTKLQEKEFYIAGQSREVCVQSTKTLLQNEGLRVKVLEHRTLS